jgi:deoxyribodipyrimidine photo-lyase
MSPFDEDPRVTVRRPGPANPDGRAILYWMQRAQRGADNPALDLAIEWGNRLGKPVVVTLALIPDYPHASLRHYQFMVEGLPDLAGELAKRRVGFLIRRGADAEVARVANEVEAALVVGDENPLREMERWREQVARRVRVPFWTVDADVIVPTSLLEKEQYAARTIRPRMARQLPWFLVASKEPVARVPWVTPARLSSLAPGDALLEGLGIDRRVNAVPGCRGGRKEGRRLLTRFIRRRLAGYDTGRNDPALDATSHLSPYLHFGQLGPREVALAVRESGAPPADRDAYLEQLIVRRELAINFVRYNPRYDRLDGCEPWARATLARHRHDTRDRVYSERALEQAETHDPLWNAAQRQMVDTGWMHGYLRMYWAKKILEWTRSPERAMAVAVTLNDRYQLDGRDPNGYAGIAWAIGGKHDRAWGPERPVFGTIRYMSGRRLRAEGLIGLRARSRRP